MTCDRCGVAYQIGDWPWCPHGQATSARGFEPHFDMALGAYVTGWGDVHQAMRQHGLDYRDHMSPGDLSARRDRIAQRRRG